MIHFITGNRRKFDEVRAIIPELEQLDLDLPEIQALDPHAIIRAKLEAAREHHDGSFIVEDVSVSLEALNGLPGPLIKWFERSIGNEGIVELSQKLGDDRAAITSTIGYAAENGSMKLFDGTLTGRIVPARGNKDFGWGPIFQPDGQSQTFGEMERADKFALGYRGEAVRQLKTFFDRSRLH